MLWAFLPIAVVVTVTPGAATAMVVRGAMRGGSQAGVLVWLGTQSMRRAGREIMLERRPRRAGDVAGGWPERTTGGVLITLGVGCP